MLNLSSFAVTQTKTTGLCKLILLGTPECLGTVTWNFGTFTQNPNLEFWNLPLSALEPPGSLTCNLYSEPRNFPEPSFTWNLATSRNLAGRLSESVPGPNLAETAKLSSVGEKEAKPIGSGFATKVSFFCFRLKFYFLFAFLY